METVKKCLQTSGDDKNCLQTSGDDKNCLQKTKNIKSCLHQRNNKIKAIVDLDNPTLINVYFITN